MPCHFRFLCQLPEGYTLRSCSFLNGEMAQLIYEKRLTAHLPHPGTEECPGVDISGDYNQYTQSRILERPWGQLTLKGDGTAWSLPPVVPRRLHLLQVHTGPRSPNPEAAALADSNTTLYEAEAPTTVNFL